MVSKNLINESMDIPEGISAGIADNVLSIKGSKGETKLTLPFGRIEIKTESGKILFTSRRNTKKERQLIGSFKAHVANSLKGVISPYSYKMKICSGHFPMNVSINGSELLIKNFIGEKTPRKVQLSSEVKVIIKGTELTIEGSNKQLVGNTASSIEKITRRPNFDKRIFQDGIILVK